MSISEPVGRIARVVREPADRPSTRAVAFGGWNAVIGGCVFVGLQLVWMLFAHVLLRTRLVTRHGSLARKRVVLDTAGIIGFTGAGRSSSVGRDWRR